MVDSFIERFINGEYKISPDAVRIKCSYGYQKLNLFQFLTESINNYITAKSNLECATDEASWKKALEQEAEWRGKLQLWLTQARNAGFIIETESMTSKVKKLEQENTQLKEEIDKLQKTNLKLKKENKELHTFLDRFNGRTSVE